MSNSFGIHKALNPSEGETRNGSLSWAMTLKPMYVEAIRGGFKRYEVRTKIPRELYPGDRIFVVRSASGGKVVFCIVVDKIYRFTPIKAWSLFSYAYGISQEEYDKYTRGRFRVYLIKFGKIEEMPEGMTIRDLGLKIAPQWFQRIKRK